MLFVPREPPTLPSVGKVYLLNRVLRVYVHSRHTILVVDRDKVRVLEARPQSEMLGSGGVFCLTI